MQISLKGFCNLFKKKYFRINSKVYKHLRLTFEKEVLSNIPKKVKIGLSDGSEKNNESNEIKQWIKNYNIESYYSFNSSCLYHFTQARNLKVIVLKEYPRCEEEDLNIFLQMKTLHALNIRFKPGTK